MQPKKGREGEGEDSSASSAGLYADSAWLDAEVRERTRRAREAHARRVLAARGGGVAAPAAPTARSWWWERILKWVHQWIW
jgi:hypothetical protein